jgi:hypothetical protein
MSKDFHEETITKFECDYCGAMIYERKSLGTRMCKLSIWPYDEETLCSVQCVYESITAYHEVEVEL